MSVIVAEFAGHCGNCDQSIQEGDRIRMDLDGWVHDRCSDDNRAPSAVCAKCRWEIARNGECGCDA